MKTKNKIAADFSILDFVIKLHPAEDKQTRV